MELPLTLEKFIQMTEQIRSQRDTDLHREVRGGTAKPETILKQLQEDIKEAIEKSSGRTRYTYTLNTYNYLHDRFGKKDVEKAAMDMGNEYMRKYFPAANAITIDYGTSIYGSMSTTMSVNIHFTLPPPSTQMNTHLGQPK
jgi:hypothetical protein